MGDYELYHAERKHKYIKKIGNRYFYTQQEIQKYLAGRNVSSEAKGSVNNGSNGVEKTAKNGVNAARKKQAYEVSNYVSTRTASAADQMSKPLVKSAKKGKLRREINDAKEAVAEATGRRDVYYEAKKVTENGRTYYDDDNAKLRTGKKDKKGRVDPEDGSVYTKKGTMQYDNEYTRELNKKTRERGKKKLKKMATSPVRSLKKQTERGKKKIENLYKPKRTVVIEDRIDSRTGKHF